MARSAAAANVVALLVVCALVVGGGALLAVWLSDNDIGPFASPQVCSATVNDTTVTVSPEQGENAALIAALAAKRGLPPRAVTIALATAYQESKIVNIDYGHLDSIGLFQQRPSQGWGPRRKIMDPVYSTNRFYDGLVQVEGWQQLPVTEAAQAVQRSAYPDAYADHEADAQILASALSGEAKGGRFTCTVDPSDSSGSDDLDSSGLTERAARARDAVTEVYGSLELGGFAPGGVSSGHMEGSAHYDGRAVDVLLRPVNGANRTRGWSIAAYLVAHADRLDIATVIYDGRIWTARRSESGWRAYTPPSSSDDPATQAVLEHRDHVHFDVRD